MIRLYYLFHNWATKSEHGLSERKSYLVSDTLHSHKSEFLGFAQNTLRHLGTELDCCKFVCAIVRHLHMFCYSPPKIRIHSNLHRLKKITTASVNPLISWVFSSREQSNGKLVTVKIDVGLHRWTRRVSTEVFFFRN